MPPAPFFSGLVAPSPAELARVNASLPVCESFELADLDGWQQLVTPVNDPATWLRFERQQRNDCQAHGLTTCREIIHHRAGDSRKGVQLSRSFAYNTCEQVSGFQLGGDSGTTIQSGVELLTKHGLPTEADYPYNQYTGDARQLQRWRQAVQSSLSLSKIAKGTLAPAWKTAIASTALGHPLTMGMMWPLFGQAGTINGKKFYRRYNRQHGDGGHALCGAFPIILDSGEVVMMVVNSHGDEYFVIDERFYEEARASSPFGMYQLYGSTDPVKTFYDGKLGLFTGRPL